MNRNNRTYQLITRSLDRLDAAAERGAALPPEAQAEAAMDAIGLLDELQRLRRKWDEQAAEGNPRRQPSDFRTHDQWLRRWSRSARALLPDVKDAAVAAALKAAIDRCGA